MPSCTKTLNVHQQLSLDEIIQHINSSTLKKNTIINDVEYLNKKINENVQNILKL